MVEFVTTDMRLMKWQKKNKTYKKIGFLSKNKVKEDKINPCVFKHRDNGKYLLRFIQKKDKKSKSLDIETYDGEKDKLAKLLNIKVKKLEAFILKNGNSFKKFIGDIEKSKYPGIYLIVSPKCYKRIRKTNDSKITDKEQEKYMKILLENFNFKSAGKINKMFLEGNDIKEDEEINGEGGEEDVEEEHVEEEDVEKGDEEDDEEEDDEEDDEEEDDEDKNKKKVEEEDEEAKRERNKKYHEKRKKKDDEIMEEIDNKLFPNQKKKNTPDPFDISYDLLHKPILFTEGSRESIIINALNTPWKGINFKPNNADTDTEIIESKVPKSPKNKNQKPKVNKPKKKIKTINNVGSYVEPKNPPTQKRKIETKTNSNKKQKTDSNKKQKNETDEVINLDSSKLLAFKNIKEFAMEKIFSYFDNFPDIKKKWDNNWNNVQKELKHYELSLYTFIFSFKEPKNIYNTIIYYLYFGIVNDIECSENDFLKDFGNLYEESPITIDINSCFPGTSLICNFLENHRLITENLAIKNQQITNNINYLNSILEKYNFKNELKNSEDLEKLFKIRFPIAEFFIIFHEFIRNMMDKSFLKENFLSPEFDSLNLFQNNKVENYQDFIQKEFKIPKSFSNVENLVTWIFYIYEDLNTNLNKKAKKEKIGKIKQEEIMQLF